MKHAKINKRPTINNFPIVFLIIFTLLVFGCNSKINPEDVEYIPKQDIKPIEKPQPLFQDEPEEASKRHSVIGEWMAYSKGVYYDNGDFRYPSTPNEILFIDRDNTWVFGKYKGKWGLSPITDDDWDLWGISPYFPKNKITLYGWNDDIASGPVEGGATAQFIWVIYRTGPPFENAPSQVQMKFGWT